MSPERRPFWFWKFDRWNILAAGSLAVLALALAVRLQAVPQAVVPQILPPASASQMSGEPLTLAGTAAPGAKLQFYDGDMLLGEATADPNGRWQVALPALPAGAHSLIARTLGPDGKTAITSQPLALTLAAPEAPAPTAAAPTAPAPPAITAPAPADVQAGAPLALAGTAAPGAKLQFYDGEALLGETTAGPDGRWQVTLPALPAGPHTLVARALGPDGKVAADSQPLALTLPAPEAKASPYPPPYVVTLAAGSTMTVPVSGFCMDYGKPFPSQTLTAADLAPDKVQAAIGYALQKGYTDSDPLQVQLAVWTLLSGRKIPGFMYALADEIIQFAETAPPLASTDAQVLTAALGNKLVSADITNYIDTSPSSYAYKGAGALVLKNLSGETLTLALPYGIRFQDADREGTQDMAVFPAGAQP